MNNKHINVNNLRKRVGSDNMEIKQIILVTDGESNVGVDPVHIAGKAQEQGIKISTIGIVNNKRKEKPLLELERIAEKGGGICELTDLGNLSMSLSRVTAKSVYGTIEEIVNNELNKIIDDDIKSVPPNSRKGIIDMVDRLGEEVPLRCLVVLDTSGSMGNKIEIAKKSIFELLRFLKERKGDTSIGVITYPGRQNNFYEVISNFTDDLSCLEKRFQGISTGGTTPTGPALEGAMDFIVNCKIKEFKVEEESFDPLWEYKA